MYKFCMIWFSSPESTELWWRVWVFSAECVCPVDSDSAMGWARR